MQPNFFSRTAKRVTKLTDKAKVALDDQLVSTSKKRKHEGNSAASNELKKAKAPEDEVLTWHPSNDMINTNTSVRTEEEEDVRTEGEEDVLHHTDDMITISSDETNGVEETPEEELSEYTWP